MCVRACVRACVRVLPIFLEMAKWIFIKPSLFTFINVYICIRKKIIIGFRSHGHLTVAIPRDFHISRGIVSWTGEHDGP